MSEGSLYDVTFENEGPMGINLESSSDGKDAFVVSSEHPDVKVGHCLMAVNGEALEGLSFENILEKVGSATWPRTLSFTTSTRSASTNGSATKLPLPDDFFKDLVDLTGQEEEEIKSYMESQLAAALAFVEADPETHGMKKATESDGIQVFLGNKTDAEGEETQLVLSKVQIPINAEVMMNVAVTDTTSEYKRIFKMLDPMFGDGKVLHLIPKDYTRYGGKTVRSENLQLPLVSVKWGAFVLPFPLYNRDFVFCEYTCWAENGYGVSLCMSIPKITARVQNLEESHQIVRGHMGTTGYFWKNTAGSDPKKPMGKNSMSIDLTYLLQINIKGSIPKWASNLVGPQQGLNVKRVRDYALKQRELATIFFDDNTELNGVEALTAVVEKGTSFSSTIEIKEGCELVYEWVLEDLDVVFSITGPDGAVLVAPDSFTCNISNNTPKQGRFVAEKSGVFTLTWDNSSSWFTSKTVYYHHTMVDPKDPTPWYKWPTLEEALSAE